MLVPFSIFKSPETQLPPDVQHKPELLSCEQKWAVISDVFLAAVATVGIVFAILANSGVNLGQFSAIGTSISMKGACIAAAVVGGVLLVDMVTLMILMARHISRLFDINQQLDKKAKDAANNNGVDSAKTTLLETEVQELKTQVQKLTEEKQTLADELEAFKKQGAEALDQEHETFKLEKEAAIEAINAQLTAAETKIADLQTKFEEEKAKGVDEKNTQLLERVKEYELKAELQTTAEKLQEKIDALNKQIAEETQALEEKMTAKADANKLFDDNVATLNEQNAHIANNTMELEKLNTALNTKHDAFVTATTELEELKRQIASQKAQLEKLKADAQALEENDEKLKEVHSSMKRLSDPQLLKSLRMPSNTSLENASAALKNGAEQVVVQEQDLNDSTMSVGESTELLASETSDTFNVLLDLNERTPEIISNASTTLTPEQINKQVENLLTYGDKNYKLDTFTFDKLDALKNSEKSKQTKQLEDSVKAKRETLGKVADEIKKIASEIRATPDVDHTEDLNKLQATCNAFKASLESLRNSTGKNAPKVGFFFPDPVTA